MDREIKKKFKDAYTLEYDELNTKSIVFFLS